MVKKNICGHLIEAQILEIFSDSVRELSESQLRGLMVSAEFECGPVGVSMMQTSAAPGGPEMSPASAEASYLRGMAASVAASGASPYPHPDAILPHSHHPHMQVTQAPLLKTRDLLNPIH